MQKAPDHDGRALVQVEVGKTLLLVATLVASLAKQLAVLLLRHALATLLDYRTHANLTRIGGDRRMLGHTKCPVYRMERLRGATGCRRAPRDGQAVSAT